MSSASEQAFYASGTGSRQKQHQLRSGFAVCPTMAAMRGYRLMGCRFTGAASVMQWLLRLRSYGLQGTPAKRLEIVAVGEDVAWTSRVWEGGKSRPSPGAGDTSRPRVALSPRARVPPPSTRP